MARVWLDAGHGGNDPGAVAGGIKESNIALDVVKLIGTILLNNGINVGYSRKDDTFINLSQRAKMANSFNADCFVSIHCNSADNKTAKGVETFCYKFAYRKLADCVHKNILSNGTLYKSNRGVKEGNFAVVRETNMDACLVELGFISNADDRALLTSKKQDFAKVIANGIMEYLGIKPKSNSSTNSVVIKNIDSTKAANLVKDLKAKGYNAELQ